MFEAFLERAERYVEAGKRAEAQGIYYIAGARYGQATAILAGIFSSMDRGVAVPDDEAGKAAALHDELTLLAGRLHAKVTNGRGSSLAAKEGGMPEIVEWIETLMAELDELR